MCAAAVSLLEELGFLYEPLAAFGTGYLQLAFSARDAQDVAAAGALEEFMCLSAFEIRQHDLEMLLHRTPIPEILVILGAALGDVAREHARDGENQEKIGHIDKQV